VSTPSKPPSAPGLVVQGSGWRATVPMVVLASLGSAVGARLLPTPSVTDSALTEIRMQMQVKELRDEQFRHEIRQELAGIRTRIERQDDDTRNRFVMLESRINSRREP
jgi:hypothetical protein